MAAYRKPGNPWNQFSKKPKPKPSKPPRVPPSKALPPGTKGGAVTKPGTKPPAGGTKALPPAQRGGAIEKAGPTIDVKATTVNSSSGGTRGSRPAAGGSPSAATRGGRARPGVGTPTSPINPNVQWGQSRPNSNRAGVNLPRAGAAQFRNTTADVRPANRPPTSGTSAARPTAPTSSAKPPAKPSARPSLRGVVRGALGGVGRGNAAILALSAANAVQDSMMSPAQRKQKEAAAIRPITMADMPGSRSRAANSIPRTPDSKRDPEFRRGAGAGAGDMNTNKPRPTRVADYRDAQGNLYDGNTGRLKQAAPRRSTAPTRSSGGNPPAPGSSRRQPSSGGGSSAPSRPSRPETSSGTAGKGQQWSDFNSNRGTSQTNNPLIKKDDWMMSRMKDREAGQQANDSMKVGNKFDTKSDVYTPNTKVDGSGLDTKKIDQKKVDEYKRRKNRYYD